MAGISLMKVFHYVLCIVEFASIIVISVQISMIVHKKQKTSCSHDQAMATAR